MSSKVIHRVSCDRVIYVEDESGEQWLTNRKPCTCGAERPQEPGK